MKIIFAGTPDISAEVLKAILNAGNDVVACLTQPDRPKGRGQKLTSSPVKEIAIANNIPVLQPNSLKDANIQASLREYNSDIMVVIAYGLILPQAVLDIPKHGCINIHASILPRWRGAAPIQHAILAGDKETGISIMKMDQGMDTGDVISIKKLPIDTKETSGSLYAKLTEQAAIVIKEVLAKKHFSGTPQDNLQATYAPKITKGQARLDWSKSAIEIDRAIRGYYPSPVAYTTFNDQTIRVWNAELGQFPILQNSLPGTIVAINKHAITVSTRNGCIRLLELQLPGKKVLPVTAICNANKAIKIGARFI